MRFSLALVAAISTLVAAAPFASDSSNENQIHVRELDGSQEAENFENQLTQFYKGLRKYASGKEFDYVSFEPKIEEGRAELEVFANKINNFPSVNIKLENELGLARKVFQNMVETTKAMKHYAKADKALDRLSYNMLSLNVKALTFINLQYGVDKDIDGYMGEILEVYCRFLALVEESKAFASDEKFSEVVGKYARQTAKNMDYLRRQVSSRSWGQAQCPRN